MLFRSDNILWKYGRCYGLLFSTKRPIQQQLLVLHSSIFQMHRQLDDIIEALAEYRPQTQRNYQTLKTNIRRIVMAPVRRIGANQGVAEKQPVGAAV